METISRPVIIGLIPLVGLIIHYHKSLAYIFRSLFYLLWEF